MLRFIWQSWRKSKERLILLLAGALIISSGLSYLIGLSHSNQDTLMQTLQKEWRSSYDIVVRPPGTRSVTEKQHLLEPNYLDSHSGGITLAQYHQIKKIKGIKVAAPVAVLGYANMNVSPPLDISFDKPGIYHVTYTATENNGAHQIITGKRSFYYSTAWITKIPGVLNYFAAIYTR